MHPNSTNTPNHEVRVQWGGSGAFVAKSDTTSWHEILHHFSPFCTEFCKATKRYKMHTNSTKRTKTWVYVLTGQSGVFVAKNYDMTSWHELLYQFGPFCTEFWKATKRSKMHPNCTKLIQNMSLESNGVDRVHSLRKIPILLCGTNFCTSLARFALSFVTHPIFPIGS